MLKKEERTYNLKEAQKAITKYAVKNSLATHRAIVRKLQYCTSEATIGRLMQDDLPMEERPTDMTIRTIFLYMGVDPAYLFEAEDKSVPVRKTVVNKPAEPERKYPIAFDASQSKWQIGVTFDDTKTPPTIVLSVVKNGAVLTYAKAKLLHDDDVGIIKDLSYTLHLAYKNAQQKSL